jgi:hypothetical protein
VRKLCKEDRADLLELAQYLVASDDDDEGIIRAMHEILENADIKVIPLWGRIATADVDARISQIGAECDAERARERSL